MMAPVIGQFFGKKGKVPDKYGANLAAAALPGHGHRALHNTLQSILQNTRKLAGFLLEKEAINFLFDKVGQPYITNYVSHVPARRNACNALHVMVPDLHAYNFPSDTRQCANDSGATSAGEAFFDINTFTACNSQYNHNNI